MIVIVENSGNFVADFLRLGSKTLDTPSDRKNLRKELEELCELREVIFPKSY